MRDRVEFSVVVPCYNEESAIDHTLELLERELRDCGPHEIILVDDGSTDRTWELFESLAARYPNARMVRHRRNMGYGAALKTGIRRTSGDLIVIVDADGTYPFARIRDLLKVCEVADMAVGSRTGANVKYPFIRRVPKVLLKAYVSWLVGHSVPDMNSGMRVFRRDIVERFLKILPDTFSFTTTITIAMLRNHYDVRFVPIDYAERIGKSKINPITDTIRFCQLIVRTGMYFAPLRVLLPVAGMLFLATCFSLVYDVFVLDNLADKSVLLFMFTLNVGIFALLADMIDKRSP